MKKIITGLIATCLVVSGFLFLTPAIKTICNIQQTSRSSSPAVVLSINNKTPSNHDSSISTPPEPVKNTVTFSAVGDNLIHSPIYREASTYASESESYDFKPIYNNLKSFWKNHDINWINQETLLSSSIEPSAYPDFCTPVECGDALQASGINVFSLSNNHIYDKGTNGIQSTLEYWNSVPENITTSGLWKKETESIAPIPLRTENNITFAFLSYTYGTNGITISDHSPAHIIYLNQTDIIEQQVKEARELADVVVVGVHWGVEDSHEITDEQRDCAQNLADLGTDVIIGTHPHVLQNCDWLTGSDGNPCFVAYSLGNFISSQKKTDNLVGGCLDFSVTKTKFDDGSSTVTINNPVIHPTITHYNNSFSDNRIYFLSDYTDELASKHGINNYDRPLSIETINEIVNNNIDKKYRAD